MTDDTKAILIEISRGQDLTREVGQLVLLQTSTLRSILEALQALSLSLHEMATAVQDLSRSPAISLVDRAPPGPPRPFRPRLPIHLN